MTSAAAVASSASSRWLMTTRAPMIGELPRGGGADAAGAADDENDLVRPWNG